MQQESNGLDQSQIQALAEILGVKNPDLKMQSHGKTIGEMKELKRNQANGDLPRIPANKNSNFSIREDEKHLIHITSDDDEWNSKGKKLSTPVVKKFYLNDFIKMSQTAGVRRPDGSTTHAENAFSGKIVEIIHDPRLSVSEKETKESISYQKPNEEMNETELRNKYAILYGEPSSPDDTKEQLLSLVNEKESETPIKLRASKK